MRPPMTIARSDDKYVDSLSNVELVWRDAFLDKRPD